jgi:hypothetical protein
VPRVLTARFMHETNTFSRVKTDMALIRRRDFHLENEIPQAFRGTRSALGATFEAADKYGWTLVHPVSANPNPSGIVTGDAFEQIAGMILEAADTKGRPGRSKRQIFSVKLAIPSAAPRSSPHTWRSSSAIYVRKASREGNRGSLRGQWCRSMGI